MTSLDRDSTVPGLRFRWTPFSGLTPEEVYTVLRLRQDVFILEQRCLYRDADGRDLDAWHGLGTVAGELIAHARVLPPGPTHGEPAIGRVLVAAPWRTQGVGRALMQAALDLTRTQYAGRAVRVSAQAHLESFYASLGFVRVSATYDEDGIPHCDMRREPHP